MTHVPQAWQAALLALAAFRLWRLIGFDTITERLRRKLTGLPDSWKLGDDPPDGYREWLAVFLQCPWCSGFYVALGWSAAWFAYPHATLIAATPLALSALVGLLGHFTAE